jgi:hypothetical protein
MKEFDKLDDMFNVSGEIVPKVVDVEVQYTLSWKKEEKQLMVS